MECNSQSDISNNRGNWNHLKIIHTRTIPEQHIGKARNEGTTENSHTGHCTHTAESANVKAYLMCEVTSHAAQTVNTEQLQHYIP